jgi:hypothetical protein
MSIGGYFELELSNSGEYHNSALRLNTGRNAFEYILRAKSYQKVFLPYFTCEVIFEPLQKLNIAYELYYIDEKLQPIFDFNKMGKQDVFVYNNYFGLCDRQVNEIAVKCKNLIIDNSQAFFSLPLPHIDTFYSPRKFFGLPDGAYLYIDRRLNSNLEQDVSMYRFEHLLGRIDINAEQYYDIFKKNNIELKNQPIKIMSELTQKLLNSINYNEARKKRCANFQFVHNRIRNSNLLNIELLDGSVPMLYPLLIKNGRKLKNKLIENDVFTATYWPSVLEKTESSDWEFFMVDNLVNIPIDQRYSENELILVLNLIEELR